MQWIAREMVLTLKLAVFLSALLNCNGVSIREQLEHLAEVQQENEGNHINGRRFRMQEESVILGAPSYPSHLPEAEPILPGHTLIRPAIGMLKSAVKFPHRDLENGAGVYGNINNLGLRYDSRNERLMYSGFRRMPMDIVVNPESDSDSGETLSALRKTKKKKDNVKRFVMIYPAKPKTKKNMLLKSQERVDLLLKKPLGDTRIKRSKGKQRKVSIADDFHNPTELKSLIKKHNKPYSSRNDIFEPNIGRSLASKLYASAKTLAFAKRLMRKLRRQRRQYNVVVLNQGDLGKYSGEDLDRSKEELPVISKKPKSKFLHLKDAYNHIKFNVDAPDIEEYLPSETTADDDIRSWWYFHQADFEPFDENYN